MENTEAPQAPEAPETPAPEEAAQSVTFATLFPIVFGETWKNMEESDAIAFRNLLEAFVAGAAMLREKFDADVWSGHSSGTVPTAIASIRTRNADKVPGKKAEVLTPAQLLAKRLKK